MYSVITPKSEDKYVVKVLNWLEVHLFEMTCYKIHTLAGPGRNQVYFECWFAKTAKKIVQTSSAKQTSRLEVLRAYCPSNIYTVATSTIFSFNHKEVTAANRIRALAKQLTLKSFVSKNSVAPKTHSFILNSFFKSTYRKQFFAFPLLSWFIFVYLKPITILI